MSTGTTDAIAIIGMAGTFPGARDIATYWSNILGKVEAIREAPDSWIGDPAIFNPDCTPDANQIYTRLGGFLGDLAGFDPRPFGQMPVALSGSEPDQFLAMRASAEALADAGYADRDFDRKRTGVILGHGIHPHRANVNGMQHCLALGQTVGLLRALFPTLSEEGAREIEAVMRAKLPAFNVDTLPGLVPNMMTGRIANRLDLMGPNFLVDGACASSTLAVDAAITELRRGRADMMLAGGINTSTSVLVQIVFCKIGALSRRGKCRPFDAGADGTLLGEGQGVVVLKRLEDAQRDHDRIYAVIQGIGTASDGRAMGLMAPRFEGEQLAIQRAYSACGLDPASVGLIEAHATGIPLGDEIEIRALASVFGERRPGSPHVAIGSVKSMIGHCIPAAGMASLIKVAMALHEKVLPPTLADTCRPELGFERTPFFLNIEAMPWVHSGSVPRRGALDAMGFGGINTHMIVEEAPDTAGVPTATFGFRRHGTPELFVLAAQTRDALAAAVTDLAERAMRHEGALPALAAETAARHATGPFRLAAVAADTASLREKLRGVVDKISRADTHRLKSRRGVYFSDASIEGRLAVLFPGENSQSPDMLRELAIASPLVRGWLDWLDGVFRGEREVAHRFVLYPPILGTTDAERLGLEAKLRQVDYGSEAVFTADMALFALLRALGVKADCVAGHSTGENAALFASGLVRVTPQSLAEIVRRMNAIFQDVHGSGSVPTGTLLTVGAADRASVDRVLAAHPDIHLTMDNCPNQFILFGPTATMDVVRAEFSGQGAVCTELPMSWAYHTPFVAPMADAFAGVLHEGLIGTPTMEVYSCATAAPFPTDVAGIRATMHAQYVSRVRFAETIQRMYADGVRVFLEAGPSGVLTGFVGDILRDKPHLALAVDSRRAPGLEHFLGVLGQLFVHRVPLDLAPLHAATASQSATNARMPTLESALPFIRLSDEETARVRAVLDAAAPVAEAVPRPMERNADTAFSEDLHCPTKVDGWSGFLALPFAARIELVSFEDAPAGVSDPASFADHLATTDMHHFAQAIAPLDAHRQRDWLVARIAARRAITGWLADAGHPGGIEPEIEEYARGGPLLASADGAPIHVSVAYTDGIGVAAATDRPIGIDLGRLATPDPGAPSETAFSAAERLVLAEAGWARTEMMTIARSAKEAAAKAVGQSLAGQEASFAITGVELTQETLRLAYLQSGTPSRLNAFYAVDGEYVCVVAVTA